MIEKNGVIDNKSGNPELNGEQQCCGNCVSFENEDINGNGLCDYRGDITHCDSWCEQHGFIRKIKK